MHGADHAIARSRRLFLRDDNHYGCAEATLVTLQVSYDLTAPMDSSAAMPLNGGVAYSGGICGAISGAAMAVGRLAEERMPDHRSAKGTARRLVQRLIADFDAAFGSHDCRDLIEYDISIPDQHDAFIESGVWRDTCMRQIEFAVARMHDLADRADLEHAGDTDPEETHP